MTKVFHSLLTGVDTMEKGALVGMMALAVSDFLFCVVTIPGAYLPEKFIWYDKDFVYYHTIYSNFLQNTLIKTSTWFTVILAVSRYVVVSNPIRARQYVRCIHTVIGHTNMYSDLDTITHSSHLYLEGHSDQVSRSNNLSPCLWNICEKPNIKLNIHIPLGIVRIHTAHHYIGILQL